MDTSTARQRAQLSPLWIWTVPETRPLWRYRSGQQRAFRYHDQPVRRRLRGEPATRIELVERVKARDDPQDVGRLVDRQIGAEISLISQPLRQPGLTLGAAAFHDL